VTDARFHKTVPLDPPFDDHTITLDTEPPMRVWIDVRRAISEAVPAAEAATPGDSDAIETIVDGILEKVAPIIVRHDLVSLTTGEPLRLSFGEMSPGQIKAVIAAIKAVVFEDDAKADGGEPADPLPRAARRAKAAQTRKRKSSPSPSSPVTPFRSTSRTTSSR